MTKNILICVDGESYWAMGEKAFDEAMDWVGITLKKDPKTVQKCSDVNAGFWSYGMNAIVMEGTTYDDVDEASLEKDLRFWLGEAMRPIIFMYIDMEEEEDGE